MKPRIWLLDVDGVLVQPGGYRAAVRATVNHFTNRMGLGSLAPDDATVAIYEAQGITCEWDMIPITLALVLESVCARLGGAMRFDSLQAAVDFLPGRLSGLEPLDFAPRLRTLGRFVRPGEAPADVLLEASERGESSDLFPLLSGQGVMRDLLANTRRPLLSATTSLFETYVVGSSAYRRAMGTETVLETAPMLEQYDQPLLSPDTCARLLGLVQKGEVHAAVYTARPSTPLIPSSDPLAVFLPEAEAALRLVGLESLPLVGSGQVGEAALHLHESEDRLTKPAPFHALAAIAAAWTADRPAALEWMQSVYRAQSGAGARAPALIVPPEFELHIFEDSPAGMSGGVEAARILAAFGAQVDVHLWGVTAHPEKQQALARLGAQVFPDINQAISTVVGQPAK